MFDDRATYKIYIAERADEEVGAHTFLMFVSEYDDGSVAIQQQLHFMNDGNQNKLVPNVRLGISDPVNYPDRFNDVYVQPVLVCQNSSEALEMWNNALNAAFVIGQFEDLNLAENFSKAKDAVNCRSAVMAVLRAIGIQTNSNDYAIDAGTECDAICCSISFGKAAHTPKLTELIRRNEVFVNALHLDLQTAEGDVPKRFVGRTSNSFKPMRKL